MWRDIHFRKTILSRIVSSLSKSFWTNEGVEPQVPLQSSPLAFCTHSSVLQISRAVCARFDHAPARWREQGVIEYMYVVSILVYFFCRCINRGNKSCVESGEKVITLQPGGENKMWSKILIWKKIWCDKNCSWSKNCYDWKKFGVIDKYVFSVCRPIYSIYMI